MTDKNSIDSAWLQEQLTAATWIKSSRSSGGTSCVEVAFLPRGLVCVRDSKNLDQQPLLLTSAQYTAFIGPLAQRERRPSPH